MTSRKITQEELVAVTEMVNFVSEFCDNDDAINEQWRKYVKPAFRLLGKLE